MIHVVNMYMFFFARDCAVANIPVDVNRVRLTEYRGFVGIQRLGRMTCACYDYMYCYNILHVCWTEFAMLNDIEYRGEGV